MTTVIYNASQSVLDTSAALAAQSSSNTFSSILDNLIKIEYSISTNYNYFSTYSYVGSTLRFNFSNGAYSIYSSVNLSPSSSTQGSATATNVSFVIPNVVSVSESGLFNYNYQLNSNGNLNSFYTTSSTVNAISLVTSLPTTSSSYNSTFGNESIVLHGNLSIDQNKNISGTVTSITVAADHFLKSASINGAFSISGNLLQIGQSLSSTNLTGTLTSYTETFYDGSVVSFDATSIGGASVTGTQTIEQILLNPNNYSGSDNISLKLPANASIGQPTNLNIGSGDDVLSVSGGDSISLNLGDGNDRITILDHGHTIDGGNGTDTVIYNLSLTSETIQKTGTTYIVRDSSGSDNLTNIEHLQFSDYTVNLTIQNTASNTNIADVKSIEELYVAFFNRIPDADGLEYWIGQLKAGQTLNQIATSFYNAGTQYTSLTGYSTNMSNTDFINKVYQNVLGRTSGADQGGLDYWNNKLSTGTDRGTLVSTILTSAHTFKGDPTWGWVANLLDNKITVAQEFAVTLGLNYNTASDSITHGMAIATAVTSTDTSAAVSLIGINPANIHLT